MGTRKEAKIAWKVIEMLDRSDRRTDTQSRHPRKHKRQSFRHTIEVYPLEETTENWFPHSEDAIVAWSRNLTVAGISFVVSQEILENQIVVRISPNLESVVYLCATVQKLRKVHEDFWEIGAEFQERISVEQVLDQVGERQTR